MIVKELKTQNVFICPFATAKCIQVILSPPGRGSHCYPSHNSQECCAVYQTVPYRCNRCVIHNLNIVFFFLIDHIHRTAPQRPHPCLGELWSKRRRCGHSQASWQETTTHPASLSRWCKVWFKYCMYKMTTSSWTVQDSDSTSSKIQIHKYRL